MPREQSFGFRPIPTNILRLNERPIDSRIMTIRPLLAAMRFLARHNKISFMNLGQSEILLEEEVQAIIGKNWHVQEVVACGYCGSDDNTRHLAWPLSTLDIVGDKIYPYVAGHEPIIEIDGKYYFVYPYLNCTTQEQELCGECRNGHENNCERFYRHGDEDRFQGLAHGFGARHVGRDGKVIMLGGGYAEEIIVNDNQLFEIDGQKEKWVFLDDYACMIQVFSQNEKPLNPKDPAIIIGLGSLGMTALDYLVQSGFKDIVVLFKHPIQESVIEAYQQARPDLTITAINIQDVDYFEQLAKHIKATVMKGYAGKFLHDDHYSLIVDCVGNPVSTDLIARIGNYVAIMAGLPLRGPEDYPRVTRQGITLVNAQLATRGDYTKAINRLRNSPFTNWEKIVEVHSIKEMPGALRRKGPKEYIKLLVTP